MGSKTRTDCIIESLNDAKGSLQSLTDLWQSHDSTWESSPKIYQQAAKAALDLGEGFLAYDIATEGLAHFKSDPLLAQMQALALARTGSPEAANAALRKLADAGHKDEETLGLLARTHKDLWQLAIDKEDAKRHLKELNFFVKPVTKKCTSQLISLSWPSFHPPLQRVFTISERKLCGG